MTVQPTQRALRDFLTFADDASELVVAGGREEFFGDRTRQLAAEALLHRLGEAVGRLPSEFVDTHPEVDWRAIRAMRNVVAHRYGLVDLDLVWTALARDLPRDAQAVRRLLPADA